MPSPTNLSLQKAQTKYDTSVKIEFGLISEEYQMRILKFAVKSSSESHDLMVFYRENAAVKIATPDMKDANGQFVNYNAANKNYDVLGGSDITDIIEARAVIPTMFNSPVWKPQFEYKDSMIDTDGTIIRKQKHAMIAKKQAIIIDPLKKYCLDVAGLVVFDNKQVATTIKIADTDAVTKRIYGDITKSFHDNEQAFFEMMTAMEVLSSGSENEVSTGILCGDNGQTIFDLYDRANENKYLTAEEIFKSNKKKYSVKKFLRTEILPIKGWDASFGPGYMVGILENSLAYDDLKMNQSVMKLEETRQAYFFNVTDSGGATVLDELGIFLFRFNGELGQRTYATIDVTPVAP